MREVEERDESDGKQEIGDDTDDEQQQKAIQESIKLKSISKDDENVHNEERGEEDDTYFDGPVPVDSANSYETTKFKLGLNIAVHYVEPPEAEANRRRFHAVERPWIGLNKVCSLL